MRRWWPTWAAYTAVAWLSFFAGMVAEALLEEWDR